MNIDSKRLDRAIALYKGEAPPPKPRAVSKKAKKPKRSKRARSAYSFFVAASSEKWKAEHPDQNFAEFSRFCSGAWKELEDKSEFVKMANEDRKRRERELEEEDDDDDLDDEDEVDVELEDVAPKEATDRSVDEGPPFSRAALEREKMPRLRLLCFT